jgi:2-polyprenyl-6-methoxyphenol hydroxylase-like FAD-dependent oxidoreductase
MNTGIQDAVALGHALAGGLAGRADETRLDEYERIRRPIAERVVAFTDRITRAATLRVAERGRCAISPSVWSAGSARRRTGSRSSSRGCATAEPRRATVAHGRPARPGLKASPESVR